MADTILYPSNWSFVKLGDTSSVFTQFECVNNPDLCLPLRNFNDLRFQLYASVLSSAPAVFLPSRVIVAYPIPGDLDCDEVTLDIIPDLDVRPIVAVTTEVEDIEGIVGVVSFKTVSDPDIENAPTTYGTIAVGQCFRFLIYEFWISNGDTVVEENILGCTNCFTRVDERCFYSNVQYQNNENSYGFMYTYNGSSLSNPNRVLLPLYLHSPQLPSEETSYRKSDGNYIKLSERIEEEVELETDNFQMPWHRNLKVALAHDTLLIFSPNYIQTAGPQSTNGLIATYTAFVNKEGYELEHPDPTMTLLAKGKTKLTVSAALSLTNSNCI